MDYISPYGADPGDPYVDDNEALEVDGSIPPAQFFNDVQAELLNLLAAAGIVPAAGDLTQVAQAIQRRRCSSTWMRQLTARCARMCRTPWRLGIRTQVTILEALCPAP